MKPAIAAVVLSLLGQVWAIDPLPIRRTIVTPEQLAVELGRDDRSTWVRLTRAEFEAKVARATAGQERQQRPPLLLRSRYIADIDGEWMTGSSQWAIQPQGTAPGCLSIEPFSLALRSIKWSTGANALIGPLHESAGGWQVLVEGDDEKTLQFTWSARGRRRPDGQYFSLQIPAAGVTTWDIRVPATQALIVKTDQCQILDVRAEGSTHRIWSLAASATRQLDFVIAPIAAEPPKWLIEQRQKCQLNSATINCEWQMQATVAPLRADHLDFEIDAAVVVTEISSPNLKSWENPRPNLYRVQFAEPTASATISVRGLTSMKDNSMWICPTLTVVNAVPVGDTIFLNIASDVGLDDFRPGSYRIMNSHFLPTGQHLLTLQSSWTRQADPSRPFGRLRRATGTVDVAENYLWEVTPDRQSITNRMSIRPRHEPLTKWAITLPPKWDVDNVTGPSNVQMSWTVGRDADQRGTLRLEFDQPIPLGQECLLTIDYRGPPVGTMETLLAFPMFEPQRIRHRSMRWQIRGSPLLDLRPEVGPFALAYAEDEGPPPDGASPVTWMFPMGRVEGQLAVQPKTARFSASGAGRLRVHHDQLLTEYRLALRPEFGSLTGVRVIAPASSRVTGHWQADSGGRIRSCKRIDPWGRAIASFAAGDSALSAVSLAGLPHHIGQVWQISFDHPISQPITLDYTESSRRETDLPAAAAQWLAGLASDSMVNEAVAALIPPPDTSLITPALWSVAGALSQEHTWRYYDFSNRTQPPVEWRTTEGVPTLRYRDVSPDTPIDLEGRESRRLLIAKARITAALINADRVMVRYQATIRGASGSRVPLDLPTNAELVEVQLAGHAVSGAHQRGQRVELVIPDESGTVAVEIVYTVPGLGIWPVGRLLAEAPRWPGDVDATLWSWQLPLGWNALFVARAETSAKMAASATDHLGYQIFPGDGPALWVTQPIAFRRAGWMIATLALVVALLWQPQRVGTLFALAATVIAWIIVPGPARGLLLGPLVVFAGMFVWNFWNRWRWQSAFTMTTGLLFGITLTADDSKPRTVWLTLPRQNEPELVYAPVELMNQLEQLAKGGQPTTAWIVHSAKYQTHIGRDRIDTRLIWNVESLQTDREFVIPVAGHDLVELTVNGQPGIPTIRDGQLRIAMPDRRQVAIEARLVGSPKANGEDSIYRCAIPPTLQAQWQISIEGNVRLNPISVGYGVIHHSRQEYTVDLGRAAHLECSWRVAAEEPPPQVQEAYLWDLSSPSARLYGILKRPRTSEVESRWMVDVPAELVPIAVRTLHRHQSLAWEVSPSDADQRLQVLTSGPSANDLIVIELVPRQPIDLALPLPVPRCQNVTETIVAWRGNKEVRPGPTRGFLNLNEEVFRRNWLTPALMNDFAGPIHAWRKSATAGEAFIRVNAATAPTWKGDAILRWRLGPKRAELSLQAALHTDGDVLSLVECDVPLAVTITEVTGPAVAQWSRYGTRVQAWLTHPHSRAAVEIKGTVPRADESARFDVPVIRFIGASVTPSIAIASRPGWQLTAPTAQQLTPVPQSTIDELWYRVDRPNYRLVVQSRPAHQSADYRLTTLAKLADGRPTAQTTIEARSESGQLAGALITMSVSPGDEVLVQTSDLKLTEVPTLSGHRIWIVHPSAATQKKWFLHFQVIGHGAARSWSIPVVHLHFADQQLSRYHHELSLGQGLRAAESSGLVPITVNRWLSIKPNWRMDVDLTAFQVPHR
jgi:hypothetical protein